MGDPLDRRPDLTAHTTSDDGGPVLALTSPRIAEPAYIELQPADVVRHACADLSRELARVVQVFRAQRSAPPSRAGDLLGQVAKAGRNFLSKALRRPQDQYGELAMFVVDACPTWAVEDEPPLIHVVARPHEYFPWELLPLFDPAVEGRAADHVQLAEVCHAFAGFSAVVERDHGDLPLDAPILQMWDRLPIRMVYDATIPGSHHELGFLRAKGRYVELRGPYPADATDDRAPSLARQLCDPRVGIDGVAVTRPDQVLHIACHCVAVTDRPDEFAYHLADEQDRPLVVMLTDLFDELMRHWAAARLNGGAAPDRKPLVFLNACGTTVMEPASAIGLLRPFQQNSNRGVIGTAANIPDRAAADVSTWFYTELLRGACVGDALHRAKWRLLHDRGNPLGLLYGLHALAGMRVAPIPA